MAEINFTLVNIQIGTVTGHSHEKALNREYDGFAIWNATEVNAFSTDLEFWENLTIDGIKELRKEVKELKDELEKREAHSVSWSAEDFYTRANELESLDKYDQNKFEDACIQMISIHDATIGISWETIDFFLEDMCLKD